MAVWILGANPANRRPPPGNVWGLLHPMGYRLLGIPWFRPMAAIILIEIIRCFCFGRTPENRRRLAARRHHRLGESAPYGSPFSHRPNSDAVSIFFDLRILGPARGSGTRRGYYKSSPLIDSTSLGGGESRNESGPALTSRPAAVFDEVSNRRKHHR